MAVQPSVPVPQVKPSRTASQAALQPPSASSQASTPSLRQPSPQVVAMQDSFWCSQGLWLAAQLSRSQDAKPAVAQSSSTTPQPQSQTSSA